MSVGLEWRRKRIRELERASSPEIPVIVAQDFVNGGGPSTGRMFDRKGRELVALDRCEGESLEAFRARARSEVGKRPGAASIVLGGLWALEARKPLYGLPESAVRLSDVPLHASQREALALIKSSRQTD